MRRLRYLAMVACLWTFVSFTFVNLGNLLLGEALAVQALAFVLIASAVVRDPDGLPRRRWFVFAIGLHGGLMALSLLLLVLGGGTRIEMILAATLSAASLAMLIPAALFMTRRRRRAMDPPVPQRRPRADAGSGPRRRSEPYFHSRREGPAVQLREAQARRATPMAIPMPVPMPMPMAAASGRRRDYLWDMAH